MQLPPALQPWASLLAPFPDDLALTLGQLVRRLSLAIGDGHRSRPGDDGEPDGVGGISRHGPYDRLLLTEWALADELPDEFARRAASGEHAFLELARQRPAASSRTFVLIDTGPDQLGTPRLAHLALLILLARRAEARRGTLRWASLQATSFNSFDVSRSGIEALLATRTCAAPTSAALDDWLVHLDSDGHQNNYDGATEIWVIGGRRIELDGDRRVTRVTVEDVIEPGVRRLELELRRSGGIARNILLDLPDDVRTTRLVRDPFARDPFVGGPFVRSGPRLSHLALADRPGLCFGRGNHRLFARAADGGIYEVILRPNKTARCRHVQAPNGEPVIAVGRHKRRLIVVTARHGKAAVSILDRSRQPAPNSGAGEPSISTRDELGALELATHACLPDALFVTSDHDTPWSSDGLFFRTAANELIRMSWPGQSPWFFWRVAGVHAVAARGNSQLIAAVRIDEEQPLQVLITSRGLTDPHDILEIDRYAAGRILFGHRTRGPLVAVERDDEAWCIASRGHQVTMVAPTGAQVVGVASSTRFSAEELTGIVLLEEDERTLSLVSQHGSHRLAATDHAITSATTSASGPLLAYASRAGIVIHDIRRDAVVATITTVEEPS